MAIERIVIKVAVACYGGAGPLLIPVKVECTDEDVQDGSHYVAAEASAKQQRGNVGLRGFRGLIERWDEPLVAFDEKDHTGKVICGCISEETWAECPTVTV